MTIECYELDCPFHSNHHGGEGPFCDEQECQFLSADMTPQAKEVVLRTTKPTVIDN